MAIKLANPDVQPAVAHEFVFMDELSIRQLNSYDDNAPPTYVVRIDWRKYGVINTGERVFCPDNHEFVTKNYLNLAMLKAQEGDMRLLQALQSIQDAVALIVSMDTGKTTTVV